LTLQPLAVGTPGTMRVRPPKAFEMRGPEVDSVLACLVEDGAQFARAYRMGPCRIILAREPQGIGGELLWHLSISCDGFERYPTWDEIKTARYALMPDNIVVGMLLPPSDDYIDLSDTFHLWEVYDERQQWIEDRRGIHPLIPDALGAGSGSRPDSPVAPDGPKTLGRSPE
jgi:hypothetical protein